MQTKRNEKEMKITNEQMASELKQLPKLLKNDAVLRAKKGYIIVSTIARDLLHKNK